MKKKSKTSECSVATLTDAFWRRDFPFSSLFISLATDRSWRHLYSLVDMFDVKKTKKKESTWWLGESVSSFLSLVVFFAFIHLLTSCASLENDGIYRRSASAWQLGQIFQWFSRNLHQNMEIDTKETWSNGLRNSSGLCLFGLSSWHASYSRSPIAISHADSNSSSSRSLSIQFIWIDRLLSSKFEEFPSRCTQLNVLFCFR